MTECKAIACTTDSVVRGYCEKHYRRRRARGEYGQVDATAAREHVLALRANAWSIRQIDEASGTSVAAILAAGRTRHVLRETEAKILAVPLRRAVPHLVPTVGLRRRLEALACMGWPLATVAELAGMRPGYLYSLSRQGSMQSRTLRRFHAVYLKCSLWEGHSSRVARQAAERGWLPPRAWQGVDIDDPKAKPCSGFARSA